MQADDDALYVDYLIGCFGVLPIDPIIKPLRSEFHDLLQRCPRNVPHAIRHASLKDRIAWGEKPTNLSVPKLARRTVNAKGLGSISAALAVGERLGQIAFTPCNRMGLPITVADVIIRLVTAPATRRSALRTLRTSTPSPSAAMDRMVNAFAAVAAGARAAPGTRSNDRTVAVHRLAGAMPGPRRFAIALGFPRPDHGGVDQRPGFHP